MAMRSITLSTCVASTSTSTFTLGTKSTLYSDPRKVSVLPPWRPYPCTSEAVRPRMPAPLRASFTSSSLNGLMMAVTRWAMALSYGRRLLGMKAGAPSNGHVLLLSRRDGRDRLSGHAIAGQVGRGRVGHALPELDVVRRRAVLVDVEALQLPLAGDTQGPGAPDGLDGVHDEQGDAEHDHDAGQAANGLGPQLGRAPAVEEPLDHRRGVGPVGGGNAVLAGGQQPDAEGAPDPGQAVHGPSADGVVDAQVLEEIDAQGHHYSGDGSDDDGAPWRHPVAGGGDGHQPPQEAVDGDAQVPLLRSRIHEEHGHHARGACGQGGVGRHPADALPVHGRQGRARVEAVPAEPQDYATDGAHGEVVGRQRASPVPLELAPQARSQGDGTAQGDEAAHGVHDRGAGEVAEYRPPGPAVE